MGFSLYDDEGDVDGRVDDVFSERGSRERKEGGGDGFVAGVKGVEGGETSAAP